MTNREESESVEMEEQREIDEDAPPKSKRIKMRRDILEGKFDRMFDNKNTNKSAVSKAKRVKRVMSDSSDDQVNGADDKIDEEEDENVISRSRRKLLLDSEDDDEDKRDVTKSKNNRKVLSDSENEDEDKRDDVTKSKNNHKILFDSENEDEMVNEATKIAAKRNEDSNVSDESSSKDDDVVPNLHNLKGLVDSDSDDNLMEKSVSKSVEMTKSASTSKVQRMSAKQAMENMQKIKSEANRMLRSKNTSLPYHQPTQISLKDIFASKFKTSADTPKSNEISRADADTDTLIEDNKMNKSEEALVQNDDDLPVVNVNEITTENIEILSVPNDPQAQLESEEIPALKLDTTEEGNDADEGIEDATIDDLIEQMEKEDDSAKEATVVKPIKSLTLEGTEDLIDLTSGTVDAVKKLTGVELLRENFLKHNALKTTAEIERETEKKNKNRIFELKQTLGEMIVQQRIKEWISRESEKQDKLLEEEEEESEEDGKLGDKILDDVEGTDESDTDSSSSSSDEDNNDAENHDEDESEVGIAEKISKRVIRNSDDSEEEEHAGKEDFNSIEKTSEDIAAAPETNDFILHLDTQSDDVFSPNKTLNASQMKSLSAESEGIISMENEPVKIVPMKDYLADESIIEEVESQDRTIVDESELMDLCTGKFMDGLVQDNNTPQFQLTLGNSLGSPVTQNCKKNSDNLTQWSDAETNKNIDESNKKSDSCQENTGNSLLNYKGKRIIMSSEEESKEDEVNKSRKKKLLKKRDRMKAARRIAVISDDESSSSSDEFEYDAFDDNTNSDEKAAVEYDSEENEIVAASTSARTVQAGEFFENEAELTSEDEGKGSGDEDEADLDNFEREEGDDDKFNERKMKKQLERIHMRQILDEDKREVRLLQEILLEDGDLNGRSRERKFKWKDFEWSADPSGNADGEGSQTIEDMESEAVWRKQRHEREAYLREMKLKEKLANADAEDKLDNHVSYIAACSETTTATKEININKAAVPSPKKDPLLTMRRTSANISRHSTSLNRLSALLESTSSNNNETGIIGTKVDANSKGLVFAKSSPARSKDSDLMTKKRKADENVSPGAKKPSLNTEPKIRRGLLDFIEL